MKGREGEDEVHFREDDPRPDNTSPPTPITSNDMDVIIKGWEIKFEQISRSVRDVQLASEKANSDMFSISREGRAREDQQERRLEAMHVGLTEFLEKCHPAHLITSRHLDAPTRARRTRRQRPQGYRPDYVRISSSNHLLWARTSQLNQRAARIRAPGITTTSGTSAPGITTTFGARAPEITTTSGARAPGIMTTFGTRAPEITTTLGTRASESTTTLGTRAPETFTTIEIGAGATDSTNDLHMKTIGEIAATCSKILTIVE